MKLKQIERRAEGHFLLRYDLHYTLPNGGEKIYEMVSRRPLAKETEIAGSEPEGVVMVVLNREGTRVLLNREFRPAVNRVVYNFPAGLREPGETPEAAASRELWEETGLHFISAPVSYGPSYGSVGISNEATLVLLGRAEEAQPFGGRLDAAEEIEPVWLSRKQASQVLRGGAVTGRVQMFLALWAENPFAL